MGDNVKNTVLNISADTAALARVDSLLDKIAQRAKQAEDAVSRVGMGAGGRGGGLGGGGGAVPPGSPGGAPVNQGTPDPAMRMMRRGIGGTVALAAMNRVSSIAGGYAGAYYGQEGVLAGGEVSGSPFAAAQAQIQARTARGIAANQALAGGVSTVSTGAGMVGGAMLAASLSNPVGWGLAAGAAILEIANKFGEASANAELQVLQAKQSAAVGRLESVVGKRTALSDVISGGMPYGGMPSAEALGAAGSRYGYTAGQVGGKYAGYRRAGGRGLGEDVILQAQRGWGIGEETLGRFERGFLPGGGAKLGTADTQTHLETVMAEAMKAGIDASRMPEFLDRIAAYQQAGAEQGITIRAESISQFLSDFQKTTGAQGMVGARALEGMNSFRGGMLGDLTNMMAPPDMMKGMAFAEVFRRGKGVKGASKILEDPEQMQSVFAAIQARMPDMMQPFGMAQITGLAPGMAGKMKGWRPGSTTPTTLGGADSIAGRAGAWLGSEESRPILARAAQDNMETLSMTISQLETVFTGFLEFMKAALTNAKNLGPGMLAEATAKLAPTSRPAYIKSWQGGVGENVP